MCGVHVDPESSGDPTVGGARLPQFEREGRAARRWPRVGLAEGRGLGVARPWRCPLIGGDQRGVEPGYGERVTARTVGTISWLSRVVSLLPDSRIWAQIVARATP